jgi:hypothetical protein
MSVSAIVPSINTQAVDNSASVQLQRDLAKLVADTKANASQAQLSADNMAISNDQVAVAAAVTSAPVTSVPAAVTSRVDTYL